MPRQSEPFAPVDAAWLRMDDPTKSDIAWSIFTMNIPPILRQHIALAALCFMLVGCGQPQVALSTPSATPSPAPQASPSATSLPSPVPTPSPATNPKPTFAQVLVDIAGPDAASTPTVVNAPLVVSPIPLRTIPLTIGDQTIQVELATTNAERERGLMFRTALADDQGMLFVFPNDQNLSFWMRNTQLPLSIAFIDAQRLILNTEDMQPFDEQNFHLSRGPARYALEVSQGWFARHNIAAGASVIFTVPADVTIE